MPFIDETKLQIALKKLVGRAMTKGKADAGFADEKYPTNLTSSATTVFAERVPDLPHRPGPMGGTSTSEIGPQAGSITDALGNELVAGFTGGVVECVTLTLHGLTGTKYDASAQPLNLQYDGALNFHAYVAALPEGYEVKSDNPNRSTNAEPTGFTGGQLLVLSQGEVQCVPPIFGFDDPNAPTYPDSVGADARVYAGNLYDVTGATVGPLDNRQWYFDYYNGILFQERSDRDHNNVALQIPATMEVLLYVGDMVSKRIENGWDLNTGVEDGYVLKGNDAEAGLGAGVGVSGMVWTITSTNNDPNWAWPMNSSSTTGMLPPPPSGETAMVWKSDGTSEPSWQEDHSIWDANTGLTAGYVKKGTDAGESGSVWMTGFTDDEPDWRLPLSSAGETGFVDAPGAVNDQVWKTGPAGQSPAWRTDYSAAINTYDKEGLVKGASAAGGSGYVWMTGPTGHDEDPDWHPLPLNRDSGTTGMVDSGQGITSGWVWGTSGGAGQWIDNEAGIGLTCLDGQILRFSRTGTGQTGGCHNGPQGPFNITTTPPWPDPIHLQVFYNTEQSVTDVRFDVHLDDPTAVLVFAPEWVSGFTNSSFTQPGGAGNPIQVHLSGGGFAAGAENLVTFVITGGTGAHLETNALQPLGPFCAAGGQTGIGSFDCLVDMRVNEGPNSECTECIEDWFCAECCGDGEGADTDWWEAGATGGPPTGPDGNNLNHLITTSSVVIGVGSTAMTAVDHGYDTLFFVEGVPGNRSNWIENVSSQPPGTSVFGGDMVVSGNLLVGEDPSVYFTPNPNNMGVDDPFHAHILSGTFIDIGSGDGGGLYGNPVAIRQIGNRGTMMLFETESLSLISSDVHTGGLLGLSGAHLHAVQGRSQGGYNTAGQVHLVGGDHNPGVTNVPLVGLPQDQGGNIIVAGGNSPHYGGDITIFAGGDTTSTQYQHQTLGLTAGSWGGSIDIRAGQGAYAGNVSIAGGQGMFSSNIGCELDVPLPGSGWPPGGTHTGMPPYDYPIDDQIRAGDIYIDGGNEHPANETESGTLVGNVLINVVREPNLGPDIHPSVGDINSNTGWENQSESWSNVTRPQNFLDTDANPAGGAPIVPGGGGIICKFVARGHGPQPYTQMSCENYHEVVMDQEIWPNGYPNGPYKISIGYGGNDMATQVNTWGCGQQLLPTGWVTPFTAEWGFENALPGVSPNDKFHLRIFVYNDINVPGNGPNGLATLGDLVATLNQPQLFNNAPGPEGPWLEMDTAPAPSCFPYGAFPMSRFCPIRFYCPPGSENIEFSMDSSNSGGSGEHLNIGFNNGQIIESGVGIAMTTLTCPGESKYALSDQTARGCGIGAPVPRATLHVKDNGRARAMVQGSYGQPGGAGWPCMPPGNTEIEPRYDSPICVEGLREISYGAVVVAFPDMMDADYPSSSPGATGARDLLYKMPMNYLMMGQGGNNASGARYGSYSKIDVALVTTGFFTNGRYVMDSLPGPGGITVTPAPPQGFEDAAWLDQAIFVDTVDPTILSNLNNGKIEVELVSGFIDVPGATGNPNPVPAAGRIIQIKDVGGDASNVPIEIIPAIIPPGYPGSGNYETIDAYGGQSGNVCCINSDHGSYTLIADGIGGWNIL